jgi:excisionase family DNA binding protein
MEAENKTEKLCWTVDQVSEILGVSRATAYLLANTGRIPAIRISQRRLVIPKAALLKMLNSVESEKDKKRP